MDLTTTHTETSDIINFNRTSELLDDIFNFKKDRNFDGDMLSLIISYCEEHSYRLEEVGDILSESSDFKKMFEKQLVKGHHFQVKKSDNDEIILDETEW